MTITVFIPNYNHARFIGAALESLRAQTRAPDEILVIDDGSIDDSVTVVESFVARLPQLRLLRNPQNIGVCPTINRALAEAQSTHVVCLSADDWFEPTFIERMTVALARFPRAGLCVSQCVRYLEGERRLVPYGTDSELGCWFAPEGPAFFGPDDFLKLLDRRFVWLPMTGAVIERALFRSVGGCDPALAWHADWFAVYAIAVRHGFAVMPEPLSVFRVADATYSTAGMYNHRRQTETCLALYDKLKQPEFRDFHDAMRRHPAALGTFMHHLILGLLWRPRDWPFLAALLKWWLKEVVHGRRPGFLRDFVARLKHRHTVPVA